MALGIRERQFSQMMMRCGEPMNFLNQPNAGLGFTRMNKDIQRLIFILTAYSRFVPLF